LPTTRSEGSCAVDLGGSNPQGMAEFKFFHPRLPRSFILGTKKIPLAIGMKSVTTK
jgi:hypothetical protein